MSCALGQSSTKDEEDERRRGNLELIRLALLFVGLPMLELAILIEAGRRIGTLSTIAIIVVTGVLGAYLARRQGLGVMRQLQSELSQGRVPVDQLADGALILVAAAVLVTPGILTDLFGFLCLMPVTRNAIRRFLWGRFQRAVRRGSVTVFVDVQEREDPSPDVHRRDPDERFRVEGPRRTLPEDKDT